MWTPGVVFENQVSLEGVTDAIKGKSDAIVEILVVDCFDKTKCEKTKQIRFKYTISLGVNCPDMHFNAFPFDSQHCDILLQDLELTEHAKKNSLWERAQVAKGRKLTSTEYDLSLSNASVNRSGFRVEMARKYTVYRDAKSWRYWRYISAIFLVGANFWAILAILGHFLAILGNFGSFLGYFG